MRASRLAAMLVVWSLAVPFAIGGRLATLRFVWALRGWVLLSAVASFVMLLWVLRRLFEYAMRTPGSRLSATERSS